MATKQKVKSPRKPKNEKVSIDRTEALIRHNGELIEALLQAEVWTEILSPIIDETIASVIGRKTNGRWHHGEFTRTIANAEFLRGYQKCGMDIHNRIIDFVKAKQDLDRKKKVEEAEKTAPLVNPYLDELEEDSTWNQPR